MTDRKATAFLLRSGEVVWCSTLLPVFHDGKNSIFDIFKIAGLDKETLGRRTVSIYYSTLIEGGCEVDVWYAF